MTKKRKAAKARKAQPASAMRSASKSPAGMLVVKRHGQSQPFDSRKLYASVYFACRGSHASEERSEQTASKVVSKVTAMLKRRKSVDAHELFLLTARELARIDSEAGFMYEHHFDIS